MIRGWIGRSRRAGVIALVALAVLAAPVPAAARTAFFVGTVRLVAVDRPGGAAAWYWTLDQGSRVLRLTVRNVDLRQLDGQRVRVSGVVHGGSLVVRAGSVHGLPAGARARVASQQHKTAVVLIGLPSAPQMSTQSDVMKQVFGVGSPDSYSVKQYWLNQTHGLVDLVGSKHPAGDVFGPYTVSGDPNVCDFSTWTNEAQAQAHQHGFDFNSYESVIWVLPYVCGGGGSGEEPGTQVWIYGLARYVIDHELGHNFGNPHASSLRCYSDASRTTVVPLSGTCDPPSEYGDPFDPMGSGGTYPGCVLPYDNGEVPYEMEPWRKLNIGSMSLFDAPTANQAGTHTYTIAPLENSSGVRMLRLPDGRNDGRMFDLSFRQPIGLFDSNYTVPGAQNQPSGGDSNPAAVNGVLVTMDPQKLASQSPLALPNSYLLDMTPQTAGGGTNPCTHSALTGFEDAPLPNGQTWSDPQTGLTLTIDSVAMNGARVTITYAHATGRDVAAPTAPGSPHASLAKGGVVALFWSAATDSIDGVGRYIVLRDGKSIAANIRDLKTTDKPGAGKHAYSVEATDAAGNIGPPSTTVSVTVPPQPVCVVPQLHGLTLTAAKAALKRGDCTLGTVKHKHSRHAPKGKVISQSPAAGGRKPPGSKVGVVLSSGR